MQPVPVHRLATTSDYLAVLDGHRQQFGPGARYAYDNGGFVVLALIAERVSGTSFPDLVRMRVCEPAGMRDTDFLRSDEPGERTALGYLDGGGHAGVVVGPLRRPDPAVASAAGDGAPPQ